MQLYNFESWFTLLTGFAIFTMGLRVFWLDSGNKMYLAFMLSTFFLFIQNLFFFLMGQTISLDLAQTLRPWQEGSWNIGAFFIGITMWYYAEQFIPRALTKIEGYWLFSALVISPIFIYLQVFTVYGHGELTLNAENRWTIVMNQIHLVDWFRMLWTMLLYGASIYFSYLPFKYAPSRASRRLRGFVFVVYTVIMLGTFIQNYLLTIFFHVPSLLNESINVAVGALFSGLMIVNLQLNDLNSDYAIPNLLKTMTNWFVLTDDKFVIRRVNTAFTENMGKDISYWQNRPISDLFEASDWIKCKNKIAFLGENETMEWEFRIDRDGQIYYLLFAITPVFNRFKLFNKGKVKAYAFVGTNLSQFKASQNRTKAYAKELEASVDALESFAFIASHDLKEPIRNIGSFASLLRRRLGKGITSDISEYIEFIENNVKGMNQLVNAIMTIAGIRREALNFELIDLNDLLLKKQHQLKTLLSESSAQLEIENLPFIHGDAQLVQQIFQNLIENSIKYNSSKIAKITIYAPQTSIEDPVLIKIEDNGIGIEEEYRKQVFEMFKRLHSRQVYEGTGIGLAICKRIIELHHGKIWIENAREGSTGIAFVLSFPRMKN